MPSNFMTLTPRAVQGLVVVLAGLALAGCKEPSPLPVAPRMQVHYPSSHEALFSECSTMAQIALANAPRPKAMIVLPADEQKAELQSALNDIARTLRQEESTHENPQSFLTATCYARANLARY